MAAELSTTKNFGEVGRSFSAALSRAGWELKALDIDFSCGKARATIQSADLLVTLDMDRGRFAVSREIVEWSQKPIGRRGDRFIAERVSTRFMGRDKFTSAKDAVQFFCEYAQQNSRLQQIQWDREKVDQLMIQELAERIEA